VIGWNAHLNDDRLLECYLGERGIEPVNFGAAEHLDDCTRCRDRYTALVETMDELRANADAETDAVFTPERLDGQHQAIARRIASMNHAARVLAFPAQTQASSSSSMRFAPRWLAAAAAAGLFVGVGVGVFFDARARGFRPTVATVLPVSASPVQAPAVRGAQVQGAAAPKPEAASPPATNVSDPDTSDDDSAFMAELQAAFERPGARELMALDALTPRTRDISYSR
jgi:hypothetical protein